MKYIFPICIFLTSLLMLANCGCSSAKQSAQSTKSTTAKFADSGLNLSKYKTLPIKANKAYTLKSNWDLKGETYLMPEGVILKSRGGVFKNGSLIGNDTKIDTKKALFDKVSIKGYWNVPEISTSMFASLEYENSLRDVLALANPEVMNKVVIEEGDYSVSAKSFQPALTIGSNIELIINGNIRLIPNEYKGCYVLNIKDASNVTVSGRGCIFGDKHTHKGKEGEWGHGINVGGSENITIHDFNVKDCWGDCIYVGNSSKNVSIRNCKLDNGRRQGISVTSADGVTIEDCVITNVSGTDPQAAIDIEPNHKETVDNVIIRNIHCENCYGGIESWRPEDARIGTMTIEGCTVIKSQKRWPVGISYAEKARIENCTIDADNRTAILASHINDVLIINNKINSTSKSPITVSKCKKSNVKMNVINKSKY